MTISNAPASFKAFLSSFGVNQDNKTIVGRATPGSTVALSLDNFGTTLVTVTADANTGIWSYTAPNVLSNNAVVSAKALVETSFVVNIPQNTQNTAPGSTSLAYGFFANVNLSGLEGSSVYPGLNGTDFFAASASDVAYVKARSSGYSRLPFSWERLQPVLNGPLDSTYLADIKSTLDAALAAGVKMIPDCHNYMRRIIFSQTSNAPYTLDQNAYHGVDNPDGVVTRAHLVDMWTKFATYFKGHGGVYGYDIMNEPTSDNHFGPSGNGNSSDLAPIMQACVNAIAAVDTSVAIFVEGTAYSSCKNWVSGNPSYPLNDPTNQIVYSSHCYPDYDHSGTHFNYNDSASATSGDPLTATTLVDMSTSFVNWCKSNNVRGHIGETNVGIDDARWLTVLDNGLTYWKANNIGVNLWLFGSSFGANPYNLYPYNGPTTQAPQWKVIHKATGIGVSNIVLSGPRNGTAGEESLPIQISCAGYLTQDTVVTLSDNGAGGTFTPSTVTLSGGIGATTIKTVTYNQPGTKQVTITASATGLQPGSFSFTTDPANPVLSYVMANPKFSDWSASNGGLAVNSPYGSDSTGGNTAARITDNGATAQHIFNGPSVSILPGEPFEDQRLLSPSSLTFVRVFVTGDSGATVGVDVDLSNDVIYSGVVTNGAQLLGASITNGPNGFKIVRLIGILGNTDANARQWISLENNPGVTVYQGNGADVYMDSSTTTPNTIYVGPIHVINAVPISLLAPNSSYASGTGSTGSVIQIGNGTWTGNPTRYVYSWYKDGVAISGQTTNTYTVLSTDTGHNIQGGVVAVNANGSSRLVKSQTFAIGAAAYVPAGDNLITTQDLTNSKWSKQGSIVVVPNYGIAHDGTQTASRVVITGDYTNALEYDLTHANTGFQSLQVRTNPNTGDNSVYFCLRSAGADHDFNVDNSGGAQGHPTGQWFTASAPVNANEGFRMQGRGGTIDILVWGLKINEGSAPTAY